MATRNNRVMYTAAQCWKDLDSVGKAGQLYSTVLHLLYYHCMKLSNTVISLFNNIQQCTALPNSVQHCTALFYHCTASNTFLNIFFDRHQKDFKGHHKDFDGLQKDSDIHQNHCCTVVLSWIGICDMMHMCAGQCGTKLDCWTEVYSTHFIFTV
jgi:hypothetical protein